MNITAVKTLAAGGWRVTLSRSWREGPGPRGIRTETEESFVPDDPSNRHGQAVRAWITAGGEVEPADPEPEQEPVAAVLAELNDAGGTSGGFEAFVLEWLEALSEAVGTGDTTRLNAVRATVAAVRARHPAPPGP